MKLRRPLKRNMLIQKFGENKIPLYREVLKMDGHNGWDWAASNGDPVYWDCLDCEGLVIDNHIDRNGGLGIKIITEDADGLFKHLFWHLEGFACKPGQTLSTGDLIGYADNTGRSTGSHLHRSLKRVRRTKLGNYKNLDGDNGYFGGIDIEPYFKNIYVKEYIDILKAEVNILRKVVYLLKKLLKQY